MAWTDTPAEEAERDLRRELHQAMERIAELEAERDRLATELKRYGWHLEECPLSFYEPGASCSCGLDLALKRAEALNKADTK